MQCGTADLVLDNRALAFDPQYDLSPYWGYVKPMRRIRIAATVGDPLSEVFGGVGDAGNGWWALFTGYVESWDPETFVDGGRDSVVNVRCVDGFEPLARTMLNTTFAQQLSGARIDAALALANWTVGSSWVVGSDVNAVIGTMMVGPVADRAIADGLSLIVAQDIEQVSALQHIQDIAHAEGGWFFMSKPGIATFYDRHRLLKNPFLHSAISFGSYYNLLGYLDDGLPYTRVKASYGSEWIYNQVIMQTIEGAAQEVEDVDSRTAYLRRTLQQTNLPLVSDDEALSRARFMLDRYKDPQIRFDSLEFEGAVPYETWEAILALDLGDMVRIKHQPPGGYRYWSQESVLQGVTHDITEGNWKVSYWLAPHHSGDFWIVGDDWHSQVGSDAMRPAW